MEKDKAIIELPASKSIGARFLVATYFGGTLPADPYFDDNDDLQVLQQALLSLYSDEEPIDYGESPIDVHASGTAFRFVTAVCASTPGADFVITGTPRLCSRPMEPLLEVLEAAGAKITSQGKDRKGPYRVAGKILEGGEFAIRGDISSQFISALMLVAPSWKKGIKLTFSTPLVSRPYLEMTKKLMELFGIKIKLTPERVEVEPGKYKEPDGFKVEADWSSASFFYEAAALGCDNIYLRNLLPAGESLQGDSRIPEMFTYLGVESNFDEGGVKLSSTLAAGEDKKPIEMDFSHNPDIVLPYAVASLCQDRRFRFTGVHTLRHKESDRLEGLRLESLKLGYVVNYGEDYVEWDGEKCEADRNPLIRTYDDHRIAMSFAIAALKAGELRIENPDCVGKSFERFWDRLPEIGLECERDGESMRVRTAREK